jgi:hypothetical protein
MTCNDKQVIKLRRVIHMSTQAIAAIKSGITSKTARKYLNTDQLPSENKQQRHWQTRSNVFEKIWPEIADMLNKSPQLEAKTILEFLSTTDNNFQEKHLRTLQRLVRDWRANYGKEQAVMFAQILIPAAQSQSDCTVMNDLKITIAGDSFNHMLFHFMLPYSRWEHISICFSESFDSLSTGYDQAVWALGGVAKEHRTDNLTAATQASGGGRQFTLRWQEIMKHYGVMPSRNNPGVSHENGSVEKSHDLLKNNIRQQLYLRGSTNFAVISDYKAFIDNIVFKRNILRKDKLAEELELLAPLPVKKYHAPMIVDLTVSNFSTVRILKASYSVPSRLIGYKLRAYIYVNEIKLWFGQKLVQTMERLRADQNCAINYRHVIASLLRKPAAFTNYCYREYLFPTTVFRKAYDALIERYPEQGSKQYLQILQLAAIGSESEVEAALDILLQAKTTPQLSIVKELLIEPSFQVPIVNVDAPVLGQYDLLLTSSVATLV